MFAWISIASSAVMVAAAVALVASLLFLAETSRPGPAGEDANVVVARGAGVTSIGRQLEADGVIRSALVFRIATIFYARNSSLQAGEYQIPAHTSLRGVIEQLNAGRALLHPVTAAEGLTSRAIIDIIARSDVLTGDVPAVPAEGSLLPETYNVQRGMDRTALVNQMRQAQRDLLDQLWSRRAPNLPFTTQQEALTLASIVEKETGVASERPRVASVFVNRLRRGMRLESDPTIIYGVCRQFPNRCVNGRLVNETTGQQREIRQSEIDLNTGYNTYRIDGLPPTPIANPGRAAIEAVLNPPQTNDLFFVADGTGGHVFAATVAEHNRNVTNWRRLQGRAPAAPAPRR